MKVGGTAGVAAVGGNGTEGARTGALVEGASGGGGGALGVALGGALVDGAVLGVALVLALGPGGADAAAAGMTSSSSEPPSNTLSISATAIGGTSNTAARFAPDIAAHSRRIAPRGPRSTCVVGACRKRGTVGAKVEGAGAFRGGGGGGGGGEGGGADPCGNVGAGGAVERPDDPRPSRRGACDDGRDGGRGDDDREAEICALGLWPAAGEGGEGSEPAPIGA